jgi:hypothetical protein
MRFICLVLAILGMVACTPLPVQRDQYGRPELFPRAMTLRDMYRMSQQVNNDWCPKIDWYVDLMTANLQARGLLNVPPENLNDEDRQYNAYAHIVMWSLRIGCNNPDRYRS